MFNFAWTEIALIVAIAVVFIGPKDLPVAIKTITGLIKKARRMAGEFQTHVDEMVREADLHDVRDTINEIRNFDFKGTVERAVDPDGTLRDTLNSDLINPQPPPVTAADMAGTDAATIEANAAAELARPEGVDSIAEAEPETPRPAFIPPGFDLAAFFLPAPPEPAPAEPPAFIPPGVASPNPSR